MPIVAPTPINPKENKALAGQNHDLGINLNNNCPKGIHSLKKKNTVKNSQKRSTRSKAVQTSQNWSKRSRTVKRAKYGEKRSKMLKNGEKKMVKNG